MQPTTLVSALQETLDRTRNQTVGVVAGFASDLYGDWFGSSGLANITANIPLQPGDRFQIGSITKTFVATVVLQLVQEGKLSLDDTLAQRLPASLVGRIPNNPQIQIRQLLNHTSGVFNYVDVLFDNATNLFREWTAAELIAFAYDNAYFAPGESWRYANTNYILLGEIVEAVTGQSLSQTVRDRILTPLGMTNTFFATEEDVPGGVVNAYWDINNDGILNDVSFLNLTWAGASGDMVSNAQDLTKFGQALLRDGLLLKPESLQQMLTLVPTPNSNTFNGYGLGIARLRSVEGTVYGHNGLTLGHRANLWYSPAENLTYVDLQNTRVFTNYVAPLFTTYREELSMPMPVVSLQTISLLLDSSDTILAPAIVTDPTAGISVLSFILDADGEIPENGLIVTVNSNIQFRDNFAFLAERPFIVGGELAGAVFNAAGEATGFKFRLTSPRAVLNLRPQDNGNGIRDRVIFTLEAGANYTISPTAQTSEVTFYDKLNQVPVPTVQPEISLSGDGVVLNEVTGNTSTVTINLSAPPPPEGVLVYVKGDRPARGGLLGRALSEFNLFTAEVTGGTFPTPDSTANGFFMRITEQTATITLKAFPNDEEVEGIEDVQFSLQPLSGYTVNPVAKSVTLTTKDNDAARIQVSLTTTPANLIEAAGTVSTHTFNLSATPPAGGLTVSVNAPNLSEFDLSKIQVTGGTIAAVRSNGFDLTITTKEAVIKLPVLDDGIPELAERAIFSLLPGTNYQINEAARSGVFTIVDRPEFAPPSTTVTEPNDTIAKAFDTKLSAAYPKLSFTSRLDFEFRNSYQIDGKTIYVDASEDVDMYKVELKAGDLLKIDTDANQFAPGRKVDTYLRLFDATGRQILFNDDATAPDEVFESRFESYLEYTATADGIYYIGVSLYENRTYDPQKPASGMGFSSAEVDEYGTGEYTLNLALNDPNAFIPKATPIPIDPTDTDGPIISLYTISGIYGNDFDTLGFNIAAQNILAETTPDGYGSALSFVLAAAGEIPTGGVEVIINSNIALTDYFGDVGEEGYTVPYGGNLNNKPFSRGGEFLDAVYNAAGKATGFKFKLMEPFATIAFSPTNRSTPETDGDERATFTLVDSVGYQVNPAANQSIVTFTDFFDPAVEAAVIDPNKPIISLEFSTTELIESEETTTTLTLKSNQPIPSGGLQVYVTGNTQDALNEFSIFEAQFTGGVATADGAISGFYFLMLEQTATISLPVFNSTDIVEGIEQFNFELRPGAGYQVDPTKSGAVITIKDEPDSKRLLSLATESKVLVESENTEVVLNLRLSAPPPTGGTTVTFEVTSLVLPLLSQNVTVTGGSPITFPTTVIAPGTPQMQVFASFTMTEQEAIIQAPIRSSDLVNGLREGVAIKLKEGTEYQIDPTANEARLVIVDTPDQVPASTAESNDTLATAIATGLSATNRTVKFEGEIGEYTVGRGAAEIRVDGTEDVDMYRLELSAGDKLTIDVDATELGSKLQFAQLRIFDATGKEVLKTGANYFQAAPQEVFSVFNDPFAEFVAPTTGTYYVGISNIGNDYYDPNAVGSGSGWIFPGAGIENGKYSVRFDLAPATVPPVTNQSLFGDSGNNILTGGAGDDNLFGNGGNDVFDAGNGNDNIFGGSGRDVIFGGDGNDVIFGNDNGDILSGDAGDDIIYAGSGDDIIMGVTGNDTLYGGRGSDLFVFGNGDGTDMVEDFEVGIDRIGLVEGEFSFTDLTITQSGSNVVLGVASSGEALAIFKNIQASVLGVSDFITIPDVSNPEQALRLI